MDSESDDEEPKRMESLRVPATVQLCHQLELMCISNPAKNSFVLLEHLQKYRVELRREEMLGVKQTTLDTCWRC